MRIISQNGAIDLPYDGCLVWLNKEKVVVSFPNAVMAERITGVCSRNIIQVANKEEYKPGKTRKTAGGYVWSFDKGVV